eukprot:746902-Hanusia_phi.AAC.4
MLRSVRSDSAAGPGQSEALCRVTNRGFTYRRAGQGRALGPGPWPGTVTRNSRAVHCTALRRPAGANWQVAEPGFGVGRDYQTGGPRPAADPGRFH